MVPTVWRYNRYRFFFFSKEENRKHIHIDGGEGNAKFWLEPDISLSKSFNYSDKELKIIVKILREHKDELIESWNRYFKK